MPDDPPGSAPAAPDEGPAPDAPEAPEDGSLDAASDAGYGALRDLLVGPERARLEALEERLDVDDLRADELARVLPEAVRRGVDDPRLAEGLEPLVAKGFDRFIEAGQARVVEALTPVMGALIRQWVARELKTRLAELSRLLDQSFSPRSLAWRVEALATRRSFGEVVLLRSLRWRVVRALLIHADTGILLRHVSAGAAGGGQAGAVEQDPDVVSSMLTAVQSYLHDGFGADEGDAVDTIAIGDKTVWIANTPRAVLAVELAGAPDPMFRGVIDETMETIDQRAHRRLVDFVGDVDLFADLEPLLVALVERSPDPPPPRLWPSFVALAVLLGFVGFTAWTAWQAEARWRSVLDALEREPGIVVIYADRDGDRHHVRGLRDPLSSHPDDVVAPFDLSGETWRGDFEPYHAHHPPFVVERARRATDPPETVALSFADGVLTVTGQASAVWWRRHAAALGAVAGVTRVDHGGLAVEDDRLARARLLLDPPDRVELALDGETLRITGEAPAGWLARVARRGATVEGITAVDVSGAEDALEAATRRIEAVEIEFAPDVAELTPAGETELARTLDDMARLRQARPWLRFVVEGHADASGSPRRNAELRAARARAVADRLLGDPRLLGAVVPRAADARTSAGRVARIRLGAPGR